MASQVSSGTWARYMTSSGSRCCPTPAPEVLPRFTGGERLRLVIWEEPPDIRQGEGNRPQGPVMAQPKVPTDSSKGRTSSGSGRAARAPPTSHTPQSSRCSSPHPHDPETLLTSHMRLLFLQMSTCSGADDTASEGAQISVPALIHVLGEDAKAPLPGWSSADHLLAAALGWDS